MDVEALLADLAARGIQITADGDDLIARPREQLTDTARTAIRAGKAEILAYLRAQQDLEQLRSAEIDWLAHPDELTDAEADQGEPQNAAEGPLANPANPAPRCPRARPHRRPQQARLKHQPWLTTSPLVLTNRTTWPPTLSSIPTTSSTPTTTSARPSRSSAPAAATVSP